MTIPFYLITGFLGSGKTTLLKYLLNQVGSRYRIAVIQNEFAPTGIDGMELKRESPDFKLLEINNGSVFCVCQLGNFIQSVQKLVEDYQPELIFLETSGLADPINIAELLQSDQLRPGVSLAKVITVADAQNFFKGLNTITRFRHQLMISDLILINKADLAQNKLTDIEQEVRKLNPYAKIEHTIHCEADPQVLLDKSASVAERHTGKKSGGRPSIAACVLRSHGIIERESLQKFLQEMSRHAIRVKGFVNLSNETTAAFHTIFEDIRIQEISGYIGPTEIIAFGEGLTPAFLRDTYRAFAGSQVLPAGKS